MAARKRENAQKRRVRRAYDEIGGQLYDLRYAEEQGEKYTWALSRISLKECQPILDAGCGTGAFLEMLQSMDLTAVGVDFSGELLSWARKKLNSSGNLHLLMSDADYMPFRKSVFKSFFAFTLLQNVPDPNLTLTEAIRVLQDRALIVVTGLRKEYNLELFHSLLSSSGLKILEESASDLKDFVSICERER